MISDRTNSVRSFALAGVLALAMSLLGLALAAPADAQFPGTCVEYDDPCIGGVDDAGENGDNGPGGGNGGNNFGNGDGNGIGDRAGTGDADGKLPFTGYPLTGLILLLVILLAAGLTIRSGVALREKFAHKH